MRPAWGTAHGDFAIHLPGRGSQHPVVTVLCHQVTLPKHLHHACRSRANTLQEMTRPTLY